MTNQYQKGMRVHSKFGPGTITEIRGNHDILITLEKGGLKIHQTFSDITLDRQATVSPEIVDIGKPAPIPMPRSTPSLANLKAVESLRFGLVPETKLPEMTIGYDEMKSWIIGCLPQCNGGNPTIVEICGPYGTGKSHYMSLVRYIAKTEGYVTAHVEVDGQSISFGDPESFLSELWSTLSAQGLHSSTPMLDLYLRGINAGKPAPQIALRGTDRIANNYNLIKRLRQNGHLEPYEYMLDAILSSSREYTASEVNPLICRALRDTSVSVKRMIGQKVEDRPYDFAESLFGHAQICVHAGYQGLVVTIDEFEIGHHDLHWDRVIDLVKVLKEYLSGKNHYPAFPCAIFIATIGEDGHRGDEVVDSLIDECSGYYKRLEELTQENLHTIGGNVWTLYRETYGIHGAFDSFLVDEACWEVTNASGMVRAFIKHYLASLDRQYGPPGN